MQYLMTGFFITDNMFVKIALPNRVHIRIFAEPFCYTNFKSAHNCTNLPDMDGADMESAPTFVNIVTIRVSMQNLGIFYTEPCKSKLLVPSLEFEFCYVF